MINKNLRQVGYGNKAITHPDDFMAEWETYLQTATPATIKQQLQSCSPYHPNENMRWLYDRLLLELACPPAKD